MSKEIIEFKIELEGIEPKIWRIFQVEADITFSEFHKIIQKIMGWEDYHMYDFKIDNTNIIDSRSEYLEQALKREIAENEVKSNQARISDLIKNKGQKMYYMYDLGDQWEHKLTVKNIFEVENERNNFPLVIDGERACPIEDSGGQHRYQEILEIMKNPDDPDYEDIIENCLGEDFNPDYFDPEQVNRKFKKRMCKIRR